MLGVDLDGSRRIEPAHVGWPVGLDGSRRIQTDRLDDHRDDQGASDRKSDGKASKPVARPFPRRASTRASTQPAAEGPLYGAPGEWVSTIGLPRLIPSAANWSAGLSGRPAEPPHREMGPPRPKTPRPELRRGEVTGARPDTPGTCPRWRCLGRSEDGGSYGLLVLAPAFATEDAGHTQAGGPEDAGRLGADSKEEALAGAAATEGSGRRYW